MVDLDRAYLRHDVTSHQQSQQKELQEQQFRRKTLELAGVNQKIGRCWQYLATKRDETSQRNVSRALKLLVLKRTKLQQQLAEHFCEQSLAVMKCNDPYSADYG